MYIGTKMTVLGREIHWYFGIKARRMTPEVTDEPKATGPEVKDETKASDHEESEE